MREGAVVVARRLGYREGYEAGMKAQREAKRQRGDLPPPEGKSTE